jgi:hypothetical protein
MCSIAVMHAVDRAPCVRTHITAMAQGWKRWKLGLARATARDTGLRGVRSNLLLAFDHNCTRSHQVRSSALAGIPHLLFRSISSLCSRVLHAMTCNINKTLKQHKCLDINNTKGLTNIS